MLRSQPIGQQNQSQSPPPELYDIDYYKNSCEGYADDVNQLSQRLSHFDTWVKPVIDGYVLDIGHGRGELSIHSARMSNVNNVTAIDYSHDAAVMFMEHLKKQPIDVKRKITQICGDIDIVLPCLNMVFSHVIAFDVVEHIYPIQVIRLFNNLAERMPSGGKIFIITPLSHAVPNERHVWLAKTPDDLFDLVQQEQFACKYVKYSGSGEDHLFEITKR